MEPENNPDVVVREFERSDVDAPLLVVGGANYKSAYLEAIQRTTDPRIRFLGPVYESGHLTALHLGAKAYIHGHEVGGTNPSLVSAMGCARSSATDGFANLVTKAEALQRDENCYRAPVRRWVRIRPMATIARIARAIGRPKM